VGVVRPVKVALNLQATSWLGGRYYLQNLALALREHATDEVELVTVGPPDDDFAALAKPCVDVPEDADVVFPNWGLNGRTRAAQMHWIPDLQHQALPEYFGRAERWRRDRGYRRLAKAASLVVVSSEVARREVARAYRGTEARLRVLHFASVARPPATDISLLLAKHQLPERFFLLPNQFWAHKNHETAFAALADLPLPIVCTGDTHDHRRPGHLDHLLASLALSGQADRVHILGTVNRTEYLALVHAAAAILQPSLFEGWSSVVEDARAYGRPIALSDIPVHREQDPPLAVFFEATDPRDLARAAVHALALPPLSEAEAAAGQRAHAERYAARFVSLAKEALELTHANLSRIGE
jgi:glycosyltransferase involved in cell wall biosynthesis